MRCYGSLNVCTFLTHPVVLGIIMESAGCYAVPKSEIGLLQQEANEKIPDVISQNKGLNRAKFEQTNCQVLEVVSQAQLPAPRFACQQRSFRQRKSENSSNPKFVYLSSNIAVTDDLLSKHKPIKGFCGLQILSGHFSRMGILSATSEMRK